MRDPRQRLCAPLLLLCFMVGCSNPADIEDTTSSRDMSPDDMSAGDHGVDADASCSDEDGDGVCDEEDRCPGFDDLVDVDGDGVADGCDPCPEDSPDDTDGDGVCDSEDICEGGDDTLDTDGDGTPNFCDVCPQSGGDDSDADGVCDAADVCPGEDDRIDGDGDRLPDLCDPCPVDNPNDTDGDGICDSQDVCEGGDDALDTDGDGVADFCDVCEGHDDSIDDDGDMIPDGCDLCPVDNPNDSDGDMVCDSMDLCPGGDDGADTDGDGVADFCDTCPLDNPDDSDSDGICDSLDVCMGGDDSADGDGDGVADFCDPCPYDNPDDSDGDMVCDTGDLCPGSDDSVDADVDGIPDGCDPCLLDVINDDDNDGVCGNDEINTHGTDPYRYDTDEDGLSDAEELMLGSNPLDADSDGDGVADGVEVHFFRSDPQDATKRTYSPSFKASQSVGMSATERGFAGAAVEVIPDINQDGFDDFLVGAPIYPGVAGPNSGRFYVVYGTGTSADIDLGAISAGTGGFFFDGPDSYSPDLSVELCNPTQNLNDGHPCEIISPLSDIHPGWDRGVTGSALGTRVQSLGDFDGDGIADFAASAPYARVDGDIWGGKVYIFSGATAATTTMSDLEMLVPSGGSLVTGNQGAGVIMPTLSSEEFNGDVTGYEIEGGFDINGDGLADLAIQNANEMDQNPMSTVSIVYGSPQPFRAKIGDFVSGSQGFRISASGGFGFSRHIVAAGDVNGDGYGDVVINSINSGNGFDPIAQRSYLIHGGPSDTMGSMVLGSTIPAGRGQVLNQGITRPLMGFDGQGVYLHHVETGPLVSSQPVGGGGDVNGDGLADIVFTGVEPATGQATPHGAWVIFGQRGPLSTVEEVRQGTGQGFAITGLASTERFGIERMGEHVTIVRDMNGDGLDEIALGYNNASTDATLTKNGRVYVIFGKRDTTPVDFSDIAAGIGGFVVEGDHAGAALGESLDGSGDVDGDGLGDLVIGATDESNLTGPGGVVVVHGADFTRSVFGLGGPGVDTFDGLSSGETLVGGRGDDILRGNGGQDVMYGGAGNDRFEIADDTLLRVHGGTGEDTIAMVGSPWSLDPTVLRGRIFEVEAFDLSAPGKHTLDIARQDVLELQQVGNTIKVLGTAEDEVILGGGGWVSGTPDAQGLVPWSSGRAVVLVEPTVDVRTGAVFALSSYVTALPEDAATDDYVGKVSMLDPTPVTYAITQSTQPGAFAIDAQGLITVADSSMFDYETVPRLELTITATTVADQLTTTTKFFVDMIDVNEPPVWPAGTMLQAKSVQEGVLDGTSLGALDVLPEDPDEGELPFVWSIVSGDPLGIFSVDPDTGILSVANRDEIDYETSLFHTLTLRATDDEGAYSDSPPLTIQVIDQADIRTPLNLHFSAITPLWQTVNPLPDFGALKPEWARLPLQPQTGVSHLSVGNPVFSMKAQTSGNIIQDVSVQRFRGEVESTIPINTQVTYPDVVSFGQPFDFESTRTYGDATVRVSSPTWSYRFGIDFVQFQVSQLQFCAAGACTSPARNFTVDGTNEYTLSASPEVWTRTLQPSGNGYTDSFSRSKFKKDLKISWAGYINIMLRNLGLPLNVSTFDFSPFGFGYPAYRFNYTILEPYAVVRHDVDYDFAFQMTGTPYTLELEDGTVLNGELGTTLPVTLPAAADVDGDGRVKFTMSILPTTSWTTNSKHNIEFGGEYEGMSVQVDKLSATRSYAGSWPRQVGYSSSLTLKAPERTYSESFPLAFQPFVMRGSFGTTP